MSGARAVHDSTSGTMPEHARDARARAWDFAFTCYERKKAATSPVSRPDARKENLHDSGNTSIPRAS